MNQFQRAQAARDEAFRHTLANMDRWLHCAILLGFLAQEHGANPAEVNRIIMADKAVVDKMLLEKLKNVQPPVARQVVAGDSLTQPVTFAPQTIEAGEVDDEFNNYADPDIA